LVFDATFVGTVKVNTISYTAVAGVVTVSIPAGSIIIAKGSTANLYYMSIAYNLTTVHNAQTTNLSMYPNPAMNNLCISSDAIVQKVEVYSLTGVLVQHNVGNVKTINMSRLISGSYLVKVFTEKNVIKQLIIKK
jgi:pectate lyase